MWMLQFIVECNREAFLVILLSGLGFGTAVLYLLRRKRWNFKRQLLFATALSTPSLLTVLYFWQSTLGAMNEALKFVDPTQVENLRTVGSASIATCRTTGLALAVIPLVVGFILALGLNYSRSR